MAGSFGYEQEHYDVSQACGEDRLFPAMRGVGGDTVAVAPGFSCRHQIAHFTGVEAQNADAAAGDVCRGRFEARYALNVS